MSSGPEKRRQAKATGRADGLFLLEKAFIGKQAALKQGQRHRITRACKISPGIACILRRDPPRQNETIKEYREVLCLHIITKMK